LISGHSSTLTDNNGRYYLTGITNGSWSPACRAFGNTAGRNNGSNPVTVSANSPLVGVDFSVRNIELVALAPTVAEGGAATIRLQRGSAFTAAVTIPVISIGKAVLGTDFTLTPAPTDGTYTLPENVSSLDITVNATSDSATEGPEDIALALEVSSNHSMVRRIDIGGGNFVSMPGPVRASITLTDAQSTLPRVRLAAVSPLLPENSTATVRATRFGDLSQPLLIKLNIPGGTAVYGTDYQILGGSNSGRDQTIPAGQATLDIVLQGYTDSLTEGRESISLVLTNNDPAFLRDSQNTANLGIADSEIPVLSVSAPTAFAAENTSQNGIVRVTRSGATTNPLSIEYNALGTALHGTDYAALPGTLTIPAGQSSADIVIDGLPDSFADDGESVVIHLASSDEFYRLANPSATVTIGTSTVVNTLAWTGTTSGAWNESIPANWNNTTPVFGNTADVIFDGNNPISTYGTWLGDGNRTVRSIRFSNFTTPLEIRINNNSSTARTLIFAANSGNATITMDSTVTAAVTIGALAGTNNNGTSRLDSNLDVFQDSDSLLTIRRPLNESGGSWGVSKYGTGTLLLAGDNNYSGNVEVDEGTLRISNDGALGNGPKNVVVSAGATLEFEGNVNPGTAYAVTLNGSGIDGLGALYRTSGVGDTASTFSDGITLVGPTTVGAASGARYGVGGTTGTTTGLHTLTKSGAGQFDLRGTINIGNVMVAQGTFQTQASSWNNGYSIAVAENAELQLFDIINPLPRPIQLVNATINSTGSVNLTGDTLTGPITLEGTCTIRSAGDANDSLILSGPIGESASGANLNIAGTRLVRVAAACSYTGMTTIQPNATLQLDGTIPGNLAFEPGTATLAGSGTIGGNLTPQGASIISPSGTTGGTATLTVGGNLDLSALAASSGQIRLDLGAPSGSNDQLAVSGSTTLGNGIFGINDFAIQNIGGLTMGIYPLIRSNGGFVGTLQSSNLSVVLAPGLTGTLAINGNDLLLIVSNGTPYQIWAATFGLSAANAAFDFDRENDGIPNGLEWILGGNPTLSDAGSLVTATGSHATGITLNFNRSESSIGAAILSVEFGNNLATWPGSTTIGAISSSPDGNGVGVSIETAPDPDSVIVNIPSSNTSDGKLFARLKAVLLP
jgi:autotransporter-associated beta strand protein